MRSDNNLERGVRCCVSQMRQVQGFGPLHQGDPPALKFQGSQRSGHGARQGRIDHPLTAQGPADGADRPRAVKACLPTRGGQLSKKLKPLTSSHNLPPSALASGTSLSAQAIHTWPRPQALHTQNEEQLLEHNCSQHILSIVLRPLHISVLRKPPAIHMSTMLSCRHGAPMFEDLKDSHANSVLRLVSSLSNSLPDEPNSEQFRHFYIPLCLQRLHQRRGTRP